MDARGFRVGDREKGEGGMLRQGGGECSRGENKTRQTDRERCGHMSDIGRDAEAPQQRERARVCTERVEASE